MRLSPFAFDPIRSVFSLFGVLFCPILALKIPNQLKNPPKTLKIGSR